MFLTECPRDAMQGWGEFIPTDKKIDYINSLMDVGFDVLDCLRGQFTLEENARLQLIEYKFTHNTKVLFKNKLSVKARALIPVFCESYNIVTGSTFNFEHDNQIGIIVLFNGAPADPVFTRLYLLG